MKVCLPSAQVVWGLLVLERSAKTSGVPGPVGDSPFLVGMATSEKSWRIGLVVIFGRQSFVAVGGMLVTTGADLPKAQCHTR